MLFKIGGFFLKQLTSRYSKIKQNEKEIIKLTGKYWPSYDQ